MVEVLDKISKLKSVCAQETELLELKSELATPLLEDVQYIPMLAESFCELSNIGVELREIATRKKNEYLFIILLLYSLMTLAGEKLVNGLRNILAEMFGYATTLRSATQGRGTFMIVFDHYEDVPKSVQEEIIKKNGGKAE